MNVKKILVTGAAGFIGSVLIRLLLKRGYKVKCIDNLMYGGESLLGVIGNENLEFVNLDIRDYDELEKEIYEVDTVVHLAAIVGDPACRSVPELAREVNLKATINLFEISKRKKVKRFIFASTCSNYGKMRISNEYIDETGILNPLSLYAETKVKAEEYILKSATEEGFYPVCLRFATVYGLSPRIRFDLTVNEFTKELALRRELVVFGEQFWRPYCHVSDICHAIIRVIEAEEKVINKEVFNVGATTENYTKQMIIEIIKKYIPDLKIKYVHKEEDPRDYKVSFDKIKHMLGFEPMNRVEDGIKEILKLVRSGIINVDDKKYRND